MPADGAVRSAARPSRCMDPCSIGLGRDVASCRRSSSRGDVRLLVFAGRRARHRMVAARIIVQRCCWAVISAMPHRPQIATAAPPPDACLHPSAPGRPPRKRFRSRGRGSAAVPPRGLVADALAASARRGCRFFGGSRAAGGESSRDDPSIRHFTIDLAPMAWHMIVCCGRRTRLRTGPRRAARIVCREGCPRPRPDDEQNSARCRPRPGAPGGPGGDVPASG